MASRGALVLVGILLLLLLCLLTGLMEDEETTAVETQFGKALMTLHPTRAAKSYWGSYWRYFQGFLFVLSALTAVYVSAWLYIREVRDAELRERRYQEEREEKRNEKEAKRLRDKKREETERLREKRREEIENLREERREEAESQREARRDEARRKEREVAEEILRLLREGQGNREHFEREVQYPDGTRVIDRASRPGSHRDSAELRRQELRRLFRETRTAMIRYIEELQAIADAMDNFHKGATIANVAGASVSFAGGIVAIVGLALAPVTLGTSLILSAVGAGVSVAGAATKVTSGVSEAVSNRTDLNKVEEILRSCSADFETMSAALEDYENSIMTEEREEERERLLRELRSIWLEFFNTEARGAHTQNEFTDDIMVLVKDIMKSIMMLVTSLLDDIIRAAVTGAARGGAQAVAGAAAKATGIVGALFLPLDAYDIFKNARDLHRGTKADLASRIRENAANICSIVKEPHQNFSSMQRQLEMGGHFRIRPRTLTS